jgi:beta-fructofuranosidase
MFLKRTFCAAGLLFSLMSCSKDKTNHTFEPVKEETFTIYPKPTGGTSQNNGYRGWVGDVMPYYEDGEFQIFFLHDASDLVKSSSAGQHPVHKFTSTNVLDFNYEGEMIPYGNATTQDQLLGTGSVVKVGDTYYFYYTGHNSSASWLQNNNPGWATANNREAVMYATSKDLSNWTKHKDFSLRASSGYTGSDFRDPFVFYNDEFGEYWMLVSTKTATNGAIGKGVILVYTTKDPSSNNWVLKPAPLSVEGTYEMLECADIFKAGDKYYMLFAEDWSSTPGTHYRIANSTAGPWVKPADGYDMFDGHQFYAARSAADASHRYAFGWVHRRQGETDNGARTWAGNLVTHEIYPLANHKLGVRNPQSVTEYLNKEKEASVVSESGTVSRSGSNYVLNGTNGMALYKFEGIEGTAKILGTFAISNLTGTAAIGFNTNDDNTSSYTVKFEARTGRIVAYNNGVEVTRVPFNLEANKAYTFSLIIDGSVSVLYVNDEVALTNRIYSLQGKPWSFVADGVTFNVNNLKVHYH